MPRVRTADISPGPIRLNDNHDGGHVSPKCTDELRRRWEKNIAPDHAT